MKDNIYKKITWFLFHSNKCVAVDQIVARKSFDKIKG